MIPKSQDLKATVAQFRCPMCIIDLIRLVLPTIELNNKPAFPASQKYVAK
jgi:hypothetical protein